DRLAGRLQRRMRILGPEAVEDGRARERDRVSGTRRSASPAVEDDDDYEGIRSAAAHIALKESTSSDAPPTSAPSTAGCARSDAALSGFTEPPYRTGASSNDLMNSCASCAWSGVAVRPVPIAHTGSYARTRFGCGSRTESWRRRTSFVSSRSRCSSVSPTHAIT